MKKTIKFLSIMSIMAFLAVINHSVLFSGEANVAEAFDGKLDCYHEIESGGAWNITHCNGCSLITDGKTYLNNDRCAPIMQ